MSRESDVKFTRHVELIESPGVLSVKILWQIYAQFGNVSAIIIEYLTKIEGMTKVAFKRNYR